MKVAINKKARLKAGLFSMTEVNSN